MKRLSLSKPFQLRNGNEIKARRITMYRSSNTASLWTARNFTTSTVAMAF